MAANKGQQFVFNKVGENDHLPYSKAEITKVSRVADNFSFSFYQFDYQAMATNMAANMTAPKVPGAGKIGGKEMLIPVGKIVLDRGGFKQLQDEIAQLIKVMEAEEA